MHNTASYNSPLPLVQFPPDLLGVLELQFYHVSRLYQEDQPPRHHHVLPGYILRK